MPLRVIRAFRDTVRFVGVCLVVSIIVFLSLHLTPGGPAELLLGTNAGGKGGKEAIRAINRSLGLDRPLPIQYFTWLWDIIRGHLGTSVYSHHTVASLIAGAYAPTVWLIILALAISIPLSLAVGGIAAYSRTVWTARLVRFTTASALATPQFWVGIVFVVVFAVKLHWLPAGGYVSPLEDSWGFVKSMILPVSTMVLYLVGLLTRHVYSEVRQAIGQDYVRTARSMGLAKTVIIPKYVLRNSLVPIIAVAGTQMGLLISGAVLTEQVFQLGGLGQLMLQSALNKDYIVVQSTVLLITVAVLVINYGAQALSRAADPRSSVSGR